MAREKRLRKAIKFFRSFQGKSDKDIYRRAVLRFCDLVEEYLENGDEDVTSSEFWEDAD